MLNFLVALSYLVMGIFAFIILFILAYKIPRLFLSHYAKKHSMSLDYLLDEYDIFNDLTYTLDSLDCFIIVLFVAGILTIFNTLDKFSINEVVISVLLVSFIILCVVEFLCFLNLCIGLKSIQEQEQEKLHKSLIKF